MTTRNEYHYLPVDDRTAAWGFYLTTVGRVLDSVAMEAPNGVHPDMYMFDESPAPSDRVIIKSPRECGRILPEFQVILATETHAVFESDETGIVEFDGPTLLFLFPGVWHRYRPVGSSKKWLSSRWIGFNGDIAYRLMNLRSITPKIAIRGVSEPARLAAAFDLFVDRVAANPAADTILLSMRSMDLLADCIESAQDGRNAKAVKSANTQDPLELKDVSDRLIARMLDLIWTGSHRDLTTDQLCESVGAKRRSMERWFAAARGHSILTEVNLCRCRRARHFLETTDLPIKHVCWLAGFRNPDQMRANFLHAVGTLPDQYRRNHRRELH